MHAHSTMHAPHKTHRACRLGTLAALFVARRIHSLRDSVAELRRAGERRERALRVPSAAVPVRERAAEEAERVGLAELDGGGQPAHASIGINIG